MLASAPAFRYTWNQPSCPNRPLDPLPHRDLMHLDQPITPASEKNGQPWYRELNRYHWFVFVVAALGWLFDTMDQQLFNIARRPAITEVISRDQETATARAAAVALTFSPADPAIASVA